MALRITPPSYSVDDPPQWIHRSDPAWDLERFKREREQLGDREAEHPLLVYYSGSTRFSLTAPVTVPEPIRGDGPATAPPSAWLIGDPTIFEIKSLGALDWSISMTVIDKMDYELVRRGLVAVQNIDLELTRDRAGLVSPEWLDTVSRADRRLIESLAAAIYRLSSSEGAGAEGKL